MPAGEDASANIRITVHEQCGIVQEVWYTEKERKIVKSPPKYRCSVFQNLFLINDNVSFPDISRCSKFGKEWIK